MTTATVARVEAIADGDVVRVLTEFCDRFYAHVPLEQIRGAGAGQAGVAALLQLDASALSRTLSEDASLRLGRMLLAKLAADASLAPLVDEAIDAAEGAEDMVIGVILALGLVVNLTLLVATTRVKAAKNAKGEVTWSVEKKPADTELVKTVVDPVAKAAGVIG
jgi:hypothetical protein